jgi:hypothetical protein
MGFVNGPTWDWDARADSPARRAPRDHVPRQRGLMVFNFCPFRCSTEPPLRARWTVSGSIAPYSMVVLLVIINVHS